MAKESKLLMKVEKTDTGFSAYSQNHPVFTTGRSIPELIQSSIEAMGFYFDDLSTRSNDSTIFFGIDFPYTSNLST